MAQPIVIPPVINTPPGAPTAPASLAADRMRAMPYQPGMFRQPPPQTWFNGAPVMVEGQTSLAAVVRAQRDAYLVDDGMQVAGDYTDAIRAQVGGGVQYPPMPDVGYAAAGYNYPSAKMRTGAALAGTNLPTAPQFTQTRRPLPTASFEPGISKNAPPPAMRTTQANVAPRQVRGSNIRANVPAFAPPMRVPGRDYGVIETSPSDARRAVLSTLMGLGAIAPNYDAFTTLYTALQANKDLKTNAPGIYNQLVGMMQALLESKLVGTPKSQEEAALIANAKCAAPDLSGLVQVFQQKGNPAGNPAATSQQIQLCWRELLKAGARDIIQKNALAQSIDLDQMMFADQIRANVTNGKSINRAVNEWLVSWVPPDWAKAMPSFDIFPLKLDMLGLRVGMLKYLYQQQYNTEIQSQWLDSLSNELANKGDNSIKGAVSLIQTNAYKPNASPAPNVQLKAGIVPPPMSGPAAAAVPGASGAAASGGGSGGGTTRDYSLPTKTDTKTDTKAKAEDDNTLLYVGGVAALALVGVGLWMKSR